MKGAVPSLGVVTSYFWKTQEACAQSAAKLNDLNGSQDSIKVFCTPTHLIFSSVLLLPERGLTENETNMYVQAFSDIVNQVLGMSGIKDQLK